LDWNDLKLFVLVARLGGLTAAARAAGLSPPTVGRRLQALEAALGRRLFDHLPGGYALTDAGRELMARAEPLEAAALAVERWRDRGTAERVVRVSAGTWTSRFLAENIGALWSPGDAFRLQFLSAEARLDIGRRAADIGIRNRRPEEAWLAGQRLLPESFAVYARAGGPPPEGFVAPTEALTPSSNWLRAQPGIEVVVEASNPRMVLDLLLAGVGRAVLPCFVGDAEPRLARLGPPIAELAHDAWLVLHHEGRHDPAVRTVARRVVRLFRSRRSGFLGAAEADDVEEA
jgi:DNA-binding transcriptional LysR family regulator